MKIYAHFSVVGWTSEGIEYEAIGTNDKALEAIRIDSNKSQISYAVCNKENQWMDAMNNQVAGKVGEKATIHAIKIESDKKIFYRVCVNKSGWGKICKNGEIAGTYPIVENEYIIGIQMFEIESSDEETIEKCLSRADEIVDKFEQMKKNLFVKNKDKLLLASTKQYQNTNDSEVQEIQEGIILPPKLVKKTRDGVYAGGVCDKELQFVAGFERDVNRVINLTCIGSYEVKQDELEYKDISVIFGGVFIKFFGHFLSECMSRLWWILENESASSMPIAILSLNGEVGFWNGWFELLGIDKTRILFVDKPMQFKQIIIPGQTVRLWSDYLGKYTLVYDFLRDRVLANKYSKIYLTRTKLEKQDGINEQYFEDFFEKRGYKIIAPEKYNLEEQISFLSGAQEVVCTEGTLSHLALFCQEGTKLIILRRVEDSILVPQFIVNQARKLRVTYIDVTFNFLPVKHTGGVFLYGPTKNFKLFLDANKMDYRKEELEFDINKYGLEYAKKWCLNYSNKRNFASIADKDIVDVINSFCRCFEIKEISNKNYITKAKEKEDQAKNSISKLEQQLGEKEKIIYDLECKNIELSKKITELESGKGYKILQYVNKVRKSIKNAFAHKGLQDK